MCDVCVCVCVCVFVLLVFICNCLGSTTSKETSELDTSVTNLEEHLLLLDVYGAMICEATAGTDAHLVLLDMIA